MQYSLEQLKTKLKQLKDKADKAKVKEEYLTKELKDKFECESLKEGMDLLEQLVEEKEEYDEQIIIKTEEITKEMKTKGFI